MRVEHEESVRATTKYRDDLFNCKDKLIEATKIVRHCDNSILVVEKEREHAQAEKDKALAEQEKA